MANTIDPCIILRDNKSLSLLNYDDAMEAVRHTIVKDFDIEAKLVTKPIDEDVELSDEYVYRLKLYLVLFGAMAGYYRRKNERRHFANIEKYENILKIIEVINYHKMQSRLLLSDNQSKRLKLSFNCIQLSVKEYLQQEYFEEFSTIQTRINSILSTQNSDFFPCDDDDLSEICQFCLNALPKDSLKCISCDINSVNRCPFTCLQVPLFNSQWCPKCIRECGDEKEIRELLNFKESDVLLCPFCDCKLVKRKGI